MAKTTQSSLLANCCLAWMHALYNNKIMQCIVFSNIFCIFLYNKNFHLSLKCNVEFQFLLEQKFMHVYLVIFISQKVFCNVNNNNPNKIILKKCICLRQRYFFMFTCYGWLWVLDCWLKLIFEKKQNNIIIKLNLFYFVGERNLLFMK